MAAKTHENLSDMMEFGNCIEVTEDGIGDYNGAYAPVLIMYVDSNGQPIFEDDRDLHEQAESEGWELLTGYTGQSGYHGPVMHSSEYIGGGLADAILEEPGVYVAVTVETDDDREEPVGWAVARLNTEDEKIAADIDAFVEYAKKLRNKG